MGSPPTGLEAVVTGWHLLSGKERGGSDVEYIVTDRATLIPITSNPVGGLQ